MKRTPKKDNFFVSFNDIKRCLEILLNGCFSSFNFNKDFIKEAFTNYETIEEFEKSISKIHEKSINQKKDGVFYTPSDVCDYIVCNAVECLYNKDKVAFLDFDSFCKWMVESGNAFDFVFNRKILDPTSGTGEFLVSALKLKFKLLLKAKKNYELQDINNILETIHGNDIDADANNICKIRLLIQTILFTKECDDSIAISIKDNFTSFDFLSAKVRDVGTFDLVIGNPPYVEKTGISKYGNIYADILENANNFVNDGGAIGFIIPLSYVATKRMRGIRQIMESKYFKQLIANYADRPASLFTKVHQKLTILIATNNSKCGGVFVSNYKYFYREDRALLFKRRELVKLETDYGFYPKVGSQKELDIFNKVYGGGPYNLDNLKEKTGESIFLNMRGYFWNKAFTFSPGSNEYKELKYPSKIRDYILCILNSSLFWFYWVTVSDCWHITGKELSGFTVKLNKKINYELFSRLAKELEDKLESTRVYIGSVQTEYVYKHKCCKDVIDKIDDALANVYSLNFQELTMIEHYALKYRVGKKDE